MSVLWISFQGFPVAVSQVREFPGTAIKNGAMDSAFARVGRALVGGCNGNMHAVSLSCLLHLLGDVKQQP